MSSARWATTVEVDVGSSPECAESRRYDDERSLNVWASRRPPAVCAALEPHVENGDTPSPGALPAANIVGAFPSLCAKWTSPIPVTVLPREPAILERHRDTGLGRRRSPPVGGGGSLRQTPGRRAPPPASVGPGRPARPPPGAAMATPGGQPDDAGPRPPRSAAPPAPRHPPSAPLGRTRPGTALLCSWSGSPGSNPALRRVSLGRRRAGPA